MILQNNLSQSFLEKSLNKIIDGLNKHDFDGKPKVSVYDIDTGASVSINGNSPGWAASIIKFPIMVAAMKEVSRGNLKLEEKLKVDHKFTLEHGDLISNIPNGELVSVPELVCEMIVNSDNEATNMIADRIGINTINDFMWNIDMNKSMLGHLLCPKVPRYTSEFNKDGSNITTPDDMVKSIRQVYDRKFSKLDHNTRILSDYFFTYTERDNIKSKIGFISDFDDGDDVHEVGIVGNRVIYAIMINKVGQKEIKKYNKFNRGRGFIKLPYAMNNYKQVYPEEFDDDMIEYNALKNNFKSEVISGGVDMEKPAVTSDGRAFSTVIFDPDDINMNNIDLDKIIFPTHDMTLPDKTNTIKLDRPYSMDNKKFKKNSKNNNNNRDLLSEILYNKREYHYKQEEYSPTAREVHYMIKNVLINYLYL